MYWCGREETFLKKRKPLKTLIFMDIVDIQKKNLYANLYAKGM